MVLDVLVERKGYFYICGSTTMGHDVLVVLKDFLGEEMFRQLEKEKRFIKELWG